MLLTYFYMLCMQQSLSWEPPSIAGQIQCGQEISGSTTSSDRSHYWLFVNNNVRNVTFTNCNSNYDTRMVVYNNDGVDISNPYCYGGDDCDVNNYCPNSNKETFTIPSLQSQEYYINIFGYSTRYGDYKIEVLCGDPVIYGDTQMIEINGPYICNDLWDNYDIIYNINYTDCVHQQCINNDQCKMINYISNDKTSTDSRCYIFDKQCNIFKDNPESDNFIAIRGAQASCDNFPNDWKDRVGDSCEKYTEYEYCVNGKINTSVDNIISNTDFIYNLNANEVCCDCGGGVNIIDDITLFYGYAIRIYNESQTTNSFVNNDNMACGDISILHNTQQIRQWNNLNLFDLCNKLKNTIYKHYQFVIDEELYDDHKNDINCTSLIDESYDAQNVAISMCDFQNYTHNETYFIMMVDYDETDGNTFYINNQWFELDINKISENINIEYISYSKCNEQATSSDVLYKVLPCTNSSIAPSTTINSDNESGLIGGLTQDQFIAIMVVSSVVLLLLIINLIFCKYRGYDKCGCCKKRNYVNLGDNVGDVPLYGALGEDGNRKYTLYKCVICYNNKPNMFNYPCGHSNYCSECATNALQNDRKCPSCRKNIQQCKQIFPGGLQD